MIKSSFRKALRTLSVVVSLLLFHDIASAQWQQVLGPRGEDDQGINSDRAGHIYAGTDSGVFVSSDNGASWAISTTGLKEREIFCVGVTKSGAVIVGTEGGGSYRSRDFGATWAAVNNVISDTSNDLCVAGDREGNTYLGSSSLGVYFSSDDGDHWVNRSEGLANLNIWSLSVTPLGEVYAGTTGFISRTTDLGLHWTTVDTLAPKEEVLSLASDSACTVFAGTTNGKIYLSRNHGATWFTSTPFISGVGVPIECLATSGNSVYTGTYGKGCFLSNDFGLTWSPYNSGLTDVSFYSMTVTPDGYLFCGSFNANIFRTTEPLTNGVSITKPELYGLVAFPNPFSHATTLRVSLTTPEVIQVTAFDITGKVVSQIWNGALPAGSSELNFDGKHLIVGVYLVVITSSEGILTRRLVCSHL